VIAFKNHVRATHVYIIMREDGVVKVGISRRPRKRRKDLQSLMPEHRLRLVYSLKLPEAGAAFKIEQEAHERLTRCRLFGEWFRCDD
jgi:predicted GIY-YIG superfamily endonuclease